MELAVREGEGATNVLFQSKAEDGKAKDAEETFSTQLACPEHGVGIDERSLECFRSTPHMDLVRRVQV